MELALNLHNVTKRFGEVLAVDDLSLQVPAGCIYGFLGPNGAGKTTTIRMILGIFYPDSGSVRVLGDESSEAVKHRLGYLPEEKGLYKKMKTGEILAYFGRLKGMDAASAGAARALRPGGLPGAPLRGAFQRHGAEGAAGGGADSRSAAPDPG